MSPALERAAPRSLAKAVSDRIAAIEKQLQAIEDRKTVLLSRVETNPSPADWDEYAELMRKAGELSKLIGTLP